MTDSRSAGALDRLPWLSDEPLRRAAPAGRPSRDLIGWAIALVLIVAAVSFWLGSRSEPAAPPPRTSAAPPSGTAALPEPITRPHEISITAAPEVAPPTVHEVRPTPVPQVRIAPPPARKTAESEDAASNVRPVETPSAAAKSTPPAAAPKVAPPARLTPWPPRITAGAAGRLVQIGAFGSVPQAKQGWRYMVGAYPAVAHLPAVVRPDRNSKGREFYRFRVGTTSQAHSEVLCQRMEKIHLSCAVVGLPWKAKVER
jgi:hypothetical protein